MALTSEEVRQIASLARLKLTAEEEELYAEQLSAVLDYAASLSEVDTSKISPTSSVLPLTAPLRNDEIVPCPPREKIMANAPSSDEGMFSVPPVLD